MSRKIYASIHGSSRIKERVGNIKNDKTHLRNVIQKGQTKNDFKGKFYYFLLNKELKKDKKIKVFKNYIYIFNKGNHSLITVYPIPEEFLPIEQYEYTDYEKEIINNISMFGQTSMDIQTKDNLITGTIYFLENKPKELLEIVLEDKTDLQINIKDIVKYDCSINKFGYEF